MWLLVVIGSAELVVLYLLRTNIPRRNPQTATLLLINAMLFFQVWFFVCLFIVPTSLVHSLSIPPSQT